MINATFLNIAMLSAALVSVFLMSVILPNVTALGRDLTWEVKSGLTTFFGFISPKKRFFQIKGIFLSFHHFFENSKFIVFFKKFQGYYYQRK